MVLSELKSYRDAVNQEVRQRSEHVGFAGYTKHFVAFSTEPEEVAFVALDFYPKGQPLWLYDLYVPTTSRRKGIATQVLRAVENLAKTHGYALVNLHASSLDKNFPNACLIRWYEKCGYVLVKDDCRVVMSKHL
jgi:GNAT superfamily N-acetyltransferase